MRSVFKKAVAWLSLLCIGISGAGDVMLPSVAAADDSCSISSDISSQKINGGYILPDEEKSVPASDAGISYAQAMDELSFTDEGEAETVYAGRPDDEFPCSYDEDWLSYFDEHYPATRDQGIYATCWAQSAMSLAEFNMIKKGLASKDVDYSELHMAYWTYTQGTASEPAGDTKDKVFFSPVSENGIDNILNNGGSLKYAAESLMRLRGVANEKSAPYSGADFIASGGSLAANKERDDVAYLKNASLISINFNPELVKQAIVENGAAGIAIHSDRKYFDEEHDSYFCTDIGEADHALTVVGWDDYFPEEYFKECNGKLPPRQGAWLVRNSLSTVNKADFDSYFWLSYYDSSITGAWTFQMMEDFPWDNHYYYDSQIHENGRYDDVCEYANVFTANGKAGAEGERLEAVSFEMAMVEKQGSHYSVKIYGNLTGDTPDTGTLIRSATTEGTLYFEGIYTVSLNSPVILDKGEKFAVVISFDRPGSSVVMESAIEKYNGISSKVGISSGQSFVSTDRLSWADVKGTDKSYGNLVISAMTCDTQKKAVVSRIEIKPEFISFTQKGESAGVCVRLLDSNGEEAPESEYSYVSYLSGDSSVAKVDDLGRIEAVGNGRTKILAKYNGYTAECDVNVMIPMEGHAAVPVADIKDGSSIDWALDKLNFSCSTPGASVYYTLDGSVPDTESKRYTAPIAFNASMAGTEVCVKAVAYAEGLLPSDVITYEYTVPTKGSLKLTASAKGSVIRSTASGNISLTAKIMIGDTEEDPAWGYDWYVEDESILGLNAGKDMHAAVARLTGYNNGSTLISVSACDSYGESLSADISISVDIATTGDVHIEPVSVNYLYAGDGVSISCDNADAVIYYTLDGTAPSASSAVYTSPVTISQQMVGSVICVQAMAVKEGMYPSETVSANYAIKRGKPGKSPYDPIPAEIDENGFTYLVKGQSYYVDPSVSWRSGEKKIVSIDKNGLIKAKKEGSARIYAADDPDNFMDLIVTLPVVSCEKKTLLCGEESSVSLNCLLNGMDISDKYLNYIWESSNEEVLCVDETGTIKAKGSGSAVISARINGRAFGSKITVKDEIKPGKMIPTDDSLSLDLAPMQVTALKIKGIKIKDCSISGEGLSEKYNEKGKLIGYSNAVCDITPAGRITATAAGDASIILTPVNDTDRKITVNVSVKAPAERIYYMQPGKARTIRIKGVKSGGRNAAEWISDNEDVAVVIKGKVCARSAGEAVLSCNYKGFEQSIRVLVYDAILKTDEKLKIRGKYYVLELREGDEPYELNWLGEPSQKAVFKNSKNTVAFCDQYEVIHVRGKGKTVLSTVMHGKKIRIKVTVL